MDIKFTEAWRALIVRKIQQYFKENLDREIGRFEAEALLDFFSKRLARISITALFTTRRKCWRGKWTI